MTQSLLLEYLSGFPKEMFWALIAFFLPLKKKRFWFAYALIPFALLAALVEGGTFLYPALTLSEAASQFYFALHYCAVFCIYALGLRLTSRISWREAAYCVVCGYMTEHLKYCVHTLLSHILASPAWMDAWYVDRLLSILLYVPVYFLYVRRLCQDGHYLTSTLRSINLFVVCMAVMYFLSIYLLSLELSWVHAVYTSIFITVLMVNEVQTCARLQLQEEMQMKERIWALNKTQYEMSKENIDIINRKSHDLKRQLSALRTVSTPEEQNAAISEIEHAVEIYDQTFQTGNRALDTILMQEALKCSQNHIELSAVINGKLLRFMKSVDLYTMLSNILDNAIEANLQIAQEEKRSIHLSLHEKKGLIILQCENPYDGTVTLENGLPVTHKEDKSAHGFGTRSIQATAEKYGGVMHLNPSSGMYILRIIFTNQDENLPS